MGIDLPAPAADLAAAATAWSDRWWDDEVGLCWMPPDPDPATGEVLAPGLHLLPQTAWYAMGLLLRDDPGDRGRAERALSTVLDDQYDAPGEVWHGTYHLVHESPDPRADARMWVDYDPNWRQFIGCTLLLALRQLGNRLPEALLPRIDRALRLAVEGEPAGRITDNYSNISLMHAYVEVEAGLRLDEPAWVASGEDRARRVAALYDQYGAFEEYNSPTYYGIDLKALGLWRGHSSSPLLTEVGTRLETALWIDSTRWYHADLANVAGPYTRAYGMHLGQYVAAWSLWIWAGLGREVAPLPDLDGPIVHGMDLTLGPVVALIGASIPSAAQDQLRAFTDGPRLVEQRISDEGDRTATAWLGPTVMFGAERSTMDLSWWDQFHAATAHWRRADGSVGWLRARIPGRSDTSVEPGRMTLRWHHGAAPSEDFVARFVLDRPSDLGPLELHTNGPAPTADGSDLVARPSSGEVTTFTLTSTAR